MKRLGFVILILSSLFFSANAQYGILANQITDMLKPALSGSFNYKGFIDAAYLYGLESNDGKMDIVEVTTTQGFKYSTWCFMGVGAGLNIAFPQSSYYGVKNDVGVMLPLYADFRFNIGNQSNLSLFIDLKIGASFLISSNDFYVGYAYITNDECLYFKPSLGLRLPINKNNVKQAINLSASYQLITPRFSNGYNVNFNNLGVTLAFEW